MKRARLALVLLIAVVSLFVVTSTAMAENGGIVDHYAVMIRK